MATIREQIIRFTAFRLLRHLDYRDIDSPPPDTTIAACIEHVCRTKFIGDGAWNYYMGISDASAKKLIGAIRNEWRENARTARMIQDEY